MPCTDPRDVACLAEAFDLTTTEVLPWELKLIWRAEELNVIRFSAHATRAARDDSVVPAAVWRAIREGVPRSKDVTRDQKRQVGINFEGKRRGGGWIRAKVTWQVRYVVATVHAL
jgi:hypothetical protein